DAPASHLPPALGDPVTIESDRRALGALDPRLATARHEPTRPGAAGHEPADPLDDGPPDPLALLVAVTESIDEGVFAADHRAGLDDVDPHPGEAGPADRATADGPPDAAHLLVRVLATDLRPDS